MKIENFRRIESVQEPVFPKWEKIPASTSSALGNIIGSIIGVIIWLFLIAVFLLGLYLYWFADSLKTILNTFKPGSYHIPWWFSLLVVIFLAPITLIVILVGILIKVVQN